MQVGKHEHTNTNRGLELSAEPGCLHSLYPSATPCYPPPLPAPPLPPPPQVSFDADVELSQMNEYEILQLLMGDCRDKLSAYGPSIEEETKSLQSPDLTPRERLATKLRLGEMQIVQKTVDAVRRRLAPIRGLPTKAGGMSDPNQDLKEIFDVLEGLPKLPSELFGGLVSWAKGDHDPDWGEKGRGRQTPKAKRPW